MGPGEQRAEGHRGRSEPTEAESPAGLAVGSSVIADGEGRTFLIGGEVGVS